MSEQRPTKILVIDDEEAARYGIAKSLEREGYHVELASDGREALRKIQEFQPHTVISDINMPEMDGIALLREVARLDDPPPVVLVTAHGSETLAIQALRAGAYDYISKPFDVEDLRLVVRNALEQQRLKRELRESQAERIQAEKEASLGLLVAGLAHEANTPLGALSSALQTSQSAFGRLQNLLEAEENQSSGSKFEEVQKLRNALSGSCRVAQDACARLDSILKKMRDFVNLDRSDLRKVDIRQCMESTLALLKHQIKEEILIFKEYGEIPEIDCFPSDLNQVFMNLLLNCTEAIVSHGEIRIRTWHENGTVFVRILDTGKGIAPENLPKIFDPGFTTKGRGVGIGIGLPICQSKVRKHGGKIQVESEPGKGTSFTLQLPVRFEPVVDKAKSNLSSE